ncbi:MAG: hypothetical protein JO245_02455 [Pseudolabrys sp.]|nr:hypothetical protein [Pseudolabrys sp.]
MPIAQPPSPDDSASAADYVASMSEGLAVIARRHGFTALGYILEMARLEAENISAQGSGRTGN